jgi:hypothetical protein
MEKNKRGRPRLVADDTTTQVTVRLPTRLYERADARERSARDPVVEQLRRGLRRVLDDSDDD